MIYIAWVLSLITIGLLGYFSREIVERLKSVEVYIKTKTKVNQEAEEETLSVFIDPDDIEALTRQQHELRIKQLNPDD